MAWSEIINSYLNTRNKVKQINGEWVDMVKPVETQHARSGNRVTITPESETIVFNKWGKKIIIDSILFFTNTHVFPRLEISENNSVVYGTQIFHGITMEGVRTGLSPANLNFVKNDFFEVVNADVEEGKYMVNLKKQIVLPEGGTLSFKGMSSALEDGGIITYKVYWREIEEG